MGADLLIGAGMVAEAIVSYIGLEHFGLAPAFRRVVAEGRLVVHDLDAFALLEAVRAGGAGLAFRRPAARHRADRPAGGAGHLIAPGRSFHGGEAWAAPALRPTVALISCQEADEYGNAVFRGATLARPPWPWPPTR